MASSTITYGIPVALHDLIPSSPLFVQGNSLRVIGKLRTYDVESAIAVIIDNNVTLQIDTQNLRDVNFHVGSIYQFIGELHIHYDNNMLLQARIGRNVNGVDLKLYFQSLKLLQQFESQRGIRGNDT
ncbi:hypothetical protein ZOSMA_185G00420 [Zostera marina]|uniref:CST complex subunit TEN1 n=1 Tax=Zostera marina TaxID=29655 RepID=A0A0K9PQ79_ZOSMR|nr:hypothetical protein ZOSMA_185G00420 [Zostera marina]